jgi:hypothetical protein
MILTEAQAVGAWPAGSVVVKANSQLDDATPDGTLGCIRGSIDVKEPGKPARFIYCLEWDNRPGVPIFCADCNNDGTPRLELRP